MALIDKASLLMVPSTYEDGTLYNVLPSGNKAPDETGSHNGYDQTRADFTFSRGSNLAATRVNADGLIEKGRENLLTYSNDFSQWSNSGTSETSGQADKDGGTDAWLLTKSTADGYIYQNISQSGVQTYSVYLKANALNWARIQLNGSGADKYAYFDLASGLIGGSGSGNIDENIESVGNGWYRCSIVADTTSTRVRIYPADGDNDVSGTSGSIYIQSAQLEKSMVPTDYIETGSSTAQAGILEDMPRINYDANGENGALLLEPSRSNKITQAFYFGDSSWTKSGMTLTTNTSDTKSSEGVYNAAHVEATNTDPYLLAYPSVTTGDVTFSIYVKAIGDAVGRSCSIHLDYDFGTGSGTNATKTFNAPSDWTRFDVTGNCSTAGTVRVRVELGNVATVGDDFYIFGAQCENGSYPSSLIPTHGAAVTRGKDVCDVAGVSDLIGQTEGTFFVDFEYLDGQSGNNENWFALESDAGNDRILFYKGSTTNQRILITANGSNVYTNTSLFSLSANTRYKLAVRYDSGDIAVYLNGSSLITDSSTYTRTANLNNITFNESNQSLSSRFNKMVVFKEGLTNSELESLTA